MVNSVNLLLLQQRVVGSTRRSDHIPAKVFVRMISVRSSRLGLQAEHLRLTHNLKVFAAEFVLLSLDSPLVVLLRNANVELFGKSKRLNKNSINKG